MRNLLIIYPHWPPSNLTGVHRPRLISNYLKKHDWNPIVLTVHSDYYEEDLEPELVKTVSDDVRIEYTRALRLFRPRIIGDLGLRAFPFLYRKARAIIRAEKIDFIWIPIPSFYTALLGRLLNEHTKTPYGIDYIDPWIRDISTRRDVRHRLSVFLARILEPISIKNVSLISGVNDSYFMPVVDRNFSGEFKEVSQNGIKLGVNQYTGRNLVLAGMPYGFDPNDYNNLSVEETRPWQDGIAKKWVYAGAFLPKSVYFLEVFLDEYLNLQKEPNSVKIEFYFIGTGNFNNTVINEIADKRGLQNSVIELKTRKPYLEVLSLLSMADNIMIIGSTEEHYTASKVFQSILSRKPVFSILHKNSSTVKILKESKSAELLVEYDPEKPELFKSDLRKKLQLAMRNEITWEPDFSELEKYSADISAKTLCDAMEISLS